MERATVDGKTTNQGGKEDERCEKKKNRGGKKARACAAKRTEIR